MTWGQNVLRSRFRCNNLKQAVEAVAPSAGQGPKPSVMDDLNMSISPDCFIYLFLTAYYVN